MVGTLILIGFSTFCAYVLIERICLCFERVALFKYLGEESFSDGEKE